MKTDCRWKLIQWKTEFQKSFFTEEHFLVINQILEKAGKYRRGVYLAFVDLYKTQFSLNMILH